MPIWFELVALSLAAYVLGLGLGWVLWAGGGASRVPADAGTDQTPDMNEETHAS